MSIEFTNAGLKYIKRMINNELKTKKSLLINSEYKKQKELLINIRKKIIEEQQSRRESVGVNSPVSETIAQTLDISRNYDEWHYLLWEGVYTYVGKEGIDNNDLKSFYDKLDEIKIQVLKEMGFINEPHKIYQSKYSHCFLCIKYSKDCSSCPLSPGYLSNDLIACSSEEYKGLYWKLGKAKTKEELLELIVRIRDINKEKVNESV